jgi:hypothetical protein
MNVKLTHTTNMHILRAASHSLPVLRSGCYSLQNLKACMQIQLVVTTCAQSTARCSNTRILVAERRAHAQAMCVRFAALQIRELYHAGRSMAAVHTEFLARN